MAHESNSDSPKSPDSADNETSRVREQLAARLLNRGVRVHSQDTPDELGTLTEAVESFESAVEARGGDLMVDEPPPGQLAQPDNPAFVLPVRSSNESAETYASRIEALTATLRA